LLAPGAWHMSAQRSAPPAGPRGHAAVICRALMFRVAMRVAWILQSSSLQ